MSDPRGTLTVSAGDVDYELWMGMSVLAKLQSKHGLEFLETINQPENSGAGWLPDLTIMTDIVLFSLERHHEDVASKWLVDDLLAANDNLVPRLIAAAFPEAKEKPAGKPRRTKAAS